MPLVKTEAVILRTLKAGETSSLLFLYAKRCGILKLRAKSVRRAKSRLSGILQPLNVIEVVYYEKPNRDWFILSQASPVFAPQHILTDEHKTFLAMACCEMVLRLGNEGQANVKLYRLLRATLESMDRPGADHRWLFFAFQLRMLALLGFAPDMAHCAACREAIPGAARFDFANARLYCPSCGESRANAVPITAATLAALNQLSQVPLPGIGALVFSASAQWEIYRFLKTFYQYHLEELGILKTLEVLKQMKILAEEASARENVS